MKKQWLLSILIGYVGAVSCAFAQRGSTADNPIEISEAADLAAIRNNTDIQNQPHVYYKQTADIDLSGSSNWEPIGGGHAVHIHYDGNGHTISNLNIQRSGSANVGLFGWLRGSVRNLKITSGTVVGGRYAGSIAGTLDDGLIEGCESQVSVSGANKIGGLVGLMVNNSTIRFSAHRSTNVVASGYYVGGLVGEAEGGSKVEDSFAASPVSGSGAGGLIGLAAQGTATRCYWDEQVSGQTASAGGGSRLSTVNMRKRGSYSGWDFSSRWQLYEGKTYPYLRALAAQVDRPAFSPGADAYPGSSVAVMVTCSTPDATIHYVLGDGVAPSDTTSTTRVSGQSVNVLLPGRLRAVAWAPYMNPSAIRDATYSEADNVVTPVATPGDGTYVGTSMEVTLSSETENAVIRYTTNGSAPTESSTEVPANGKITVPIPSTLQAVAWRDDLNPSSILEVEYSEAETVADVVFSPSPEEGPFLEDALTVQVTCSTSDATIHYTTDGSEPTQSSPGARSGTTLVLELPATLRARAFREDWNPSGITQAAYQKRWTVADPVFSPGPEDGPFPGETVEITVTCATDNATIVYTLDGSEPTDSSASVSDGSAVEVTLGDTLKARAFVDDWEPSSIVSATYEAAGTVALPTFDPDGGSSVEATVFVTITCTTEGAEIRYTTDGSDPAFSESSGTSGVEVTVPVPGTLRAQAWKEGYIASDVTNAVFWAAGSVDTPAFSHNSGRVAAGNLQVTISTKNQDARIHYMTDGTVPTESSPRVASGTSVTVSVPGTLKARAWADDLHPSGTNTAHYTTAEVSRTPTISPDSATSDQLPISVTLSSPTPGAVIRYSLDGSDPLYSDLSVASSATILISDASTLKARAYEDGLFASPVRSAYYGDFAGGRGTEEDPYLVSTGAHLDHVRNHLTAHFKMIADIDLGVDPWNVGKGWEPIGAGYNGHFHLAGLTGTFDGNGHVVSNLFIDRPEMNEVGLFGFLDKGGVIKNVGITSGSVTGQNAVGGLVGFSWGTVQGCFVDCFVSGTESIGGLVGRSDETGWIENSYASGDVAGHGTSQYVGGLIGFFARNTIQHAYAVGSITGSSQVGGLMGFKSNLGIVNSSYWDTETSDIAFSPGGNGRTTVEMQQQETFAGWDFTEIWRIEQSGGYPRLRVFDPAVPSSLDDPWLTRFYGAPEAAPEVSIKGESLWHEYVAGTDPTDPDSQFVVKNVGRDSSTFILRAPAVPDRVYRVLLSVPDLASDSLIWAPVGHVPAQTGTVWNTELEFQIMNPVEGAYYRLSVELDD